MTSMPILFSKVAWNIVKLYEVYTFIVPPHLIKMTLTFTIELYISEQELSESFHGE